MINVMLFIRAVLHILDWQRALSNLMNTIAVIQIRNSNCDEKKTIATEMRNVFMCVLALMNALLDAISSVAASVVFSRLLISGDVESNPGPGRYPGEFSCHYIGTTRSSTILISSQFNNASFFITQTDLDYHSVDANQILGKFLQE